MDSYILQQLRLLAFLLVGAVSVTALTVFGPVEKVRPLGSTAVAQISTSSTVR